MDAGHAAWLAAPATAAITVLAIVLLDHPLGAVLLPIPDYAYWDQIRQSVHPEPTEQAGFLIALTAPLLLTALTLLLVRRPPRWAATAPGELARGIELAATLVVAGCFVAQRLQMPLTRAEPPRPIVYFTLPTLLVAGVVAGALIAGVRSTRARARFATFTAPSRLRDVVAALVVVAVLAVSLLPAINTDATIASAFEAVSYHLQYTYDETAAVLDGRSPLGDFAAQYASLWPYVLAGGMSVLGSTLGVFTGLMATLTGVSLLSLYAVLRRVVRSSVTALLLFLPLLATCGFRLHGPQFPRFSLVNYFGVLPLRYAGPFLLAWLVARHLDGARPRRAWPLFLAAGLAMLNNADFGIAAVGATVAALLWTRPQPPDRSLRALAGEAALGLAAAFAIVTALVLARTGAPPHFSLLFRYARVFVRGGYAMLPMKPLIGFDVVIFLTYVTAIGLATVRAIRTEPDRPLTGLLAWSGVFGLGAGAYYVGHSLSELLIYTFPIWAFTITLLTVVVVRSLAAHPGRRPAPSAVACLFGFGLLVCSLAQIPAPWSEAQRLGRHGPPRFARPVGQAFVARHTRPGEHVLILTTLGHRLAVNVGVDDVEPSTGTRSMFTEEELRDSLAALRRSGGRKVFVWPVETFDGQLFVLLRGYRRQAVEPRDQMELWVAR